MDKRAAKDSLACPLPFSNSWWNTPMKSSAELDICMLPLRNDRASDNLWKRHMKKHIEYTQSDKLLICIFLKQKACNAQRDKTL